MSELSRKREKGRGSGRKRIVSSREFLKSKLATASIINALAHNWGISP